MTAGAVRRHRRAWSAPAATASRPRARSRSTPATCASTARTRRPSRRPTRSRRAGGRGADQPSACRRSPRAQVLRLDELLGAPEVHPAAAALHRVDAGQGARGERHRPAVDLRADHLDDLRPRLRQHGSRASFAPTELGKLVNRLLTRLVRRPHQREVHRADGGAARRHRRGQGGLARSAGTRSGAPSPPTSRRPRREMTVGQARGRGDLGALPDLRLADDPALRPLRRVPGLLALPECKTTREPGAVRSTEEAPVCPECGAEMVQKRSRFGPFWACSRYPECKGTPAHRRAGTTAPTRRPACAAARRAATASWWRSARAAAARSGGATATRSASVTVAGQAGGPALPDLRRPFVLERKSSSKAPPGRARRGVRLQAGRGRA